MSIFQRLFSLCLFIIFIVFPQNSYAYLDPGTGSIILQALAAALAAIITTVSVYWLKIKNFFNKFFSQNNKDKDV